MVPQKTKGVLFLVFLFFGMLLTMQFRTILFAQQQTARGQTSLQTLSAELEQVRKDGNDLQEQIRIMEEEYNKLIDQWGQNDNPMLNELLQQRKEAQLYSNMTDVKGSGVIITLNDAPARTEVDPSELIIHDMDILEIMNELRFAGAQALSINDERILATSKQFCAGPTILINRNRYPVPYIIKAIGDPEALYSALEESEVVIIMRIYNIQVDIRKEQELIIPRFKPYYQNIEHMISGLEVVNE
ncbi:MAG: DUF881 domain-containing protein [Thermoclostridium sp.]|nr:DUF881 domain-containing protein [Thermoclostridium sp.]